MLGWLEGAQWDRARRPLDACGGGSESGVCPDPRCVLAVSSRARWGQPGSPKALGSEVGGHLALGQGLQGSPGPLVTDCL